MSKACSQCKKSPAIYQINGNPLCLDCAYKAEQMNNMKINQYMRQINWLTGQMEATVGMPGLFPRFEMPKPPNVIKREGDITMHNINVEKSVIGTVNTGTVGQIDVALTNIIRNGGNEELAQVLKEFTEAVIKMEEISNAERNEIIEHLSFLAGQAALPKEGRKESIIKTIIEKIGQAIQKIPALIKLFEILKNYF